jgi:hypothetical protein
MLMSAMVIPGTTGVAARSPWPSNSSSISEWRLFVKSPDVATSRRPQPARHIGGERP